MAKTTKKAFTLDDETITILDTIPMRQRSEFVRAAIKHYYVCNNLSKLKEITKKLESLVQQPLARQDKPNAKDEPVQVPLHEQVKSPEEIRASLEKKPNKAQLDILRAAREMAIEAGVPELYDNGNSNKTGGKNDN